VTTASNETICPNCGTLVIQQHKAGAPKTFCSKQCARNFDAKRKRYKRTCPVCGDTFYTRNRYQRCCSVKCRGKSQQSNLNRIVSCVICGKDFIPSHKDQQCCSNECSIVKRTQTALAKRIPKICIVCGATYYVDGFHTFAKSCSKRCADLIHTRKRRIRISQNNECFDAIEIYERDNWTCQICHKKVKKGLNGRNLLQPSLDHIIPLSLGGSHTRINVRCTHLGCNLARNNRVADQLLLIG